MKKRPFTLAEARAAGVSLDALRRKSWRRIESEIYCRVGLQPDPWRVLAAWRSQLPRDAAFAGLTAAWLFHLDVDPCNPIEVVVPSESLVRSRRGLNVRRSQGVDVALVRGLRATTLCRTFSDLRKRLSEVELLVLADQALRLNLGKFHELAERAESPMETRLRWTLIQAGLPRPQVQTRLSFGRADLYYPHARLVIEYDGGNHRDRLVQDNRRQNKLVSAGFRVLRFTSADRPEVITTQVAEALRV